MAKKMLIDATHEEEVRVAIVDGNRLEEFDSETSTKRQIKGNIYLAKVIRIEPSLQAAFVEFGGNRHGFLPFGEIHPDYFRIPVSDRLTLENEVAPLSENSEPEGKPSKKRTRKSKSQKTGSPPLAESTGSGAESLEIDALPVEESGDNSIDLVDEDELPRRPRNYHYKIQEVIKRRQIMLIQVVKEERGNKGAALTTYLSLPGRYCVLMPNAGHRGGGISRKINDGTDRRRLRDILKELEIPDGMSLIVRTAGQERNKLEIRRDFDYLLRLWEEIRDTTLKATAPALIYAEGDLIKRSIRDVYNKDIDQILVEGDEAYKEAKAFMKALIPSHTKKVQPYKDSIPLFHRHKVEEQIDVMMNPMAKLPSGGSIVINPTEALVAIDVNSGRSTRERHIDETALKTNLEAADEVARQMRLRDLAGLIVIDFIDMNDQKHIQAVEKRLREATTRDRARIQLGHISQFGLLELSRQRLRPSLMETNSSICQHCRGTGLVRSVESMSLLVLRAIEKQGIEGRSAEIVVAVPTGIDLYLLNQKRSSLTTMESRYQMQVMVTRDDTLISPEFRIECLTDRKVPYTVPHLSIGLVPPIDNEVVEKEESVSFEEADQKNQELQIAHPDSSEGTRGEGRRRRRRRPFKRRDQERNREPSLEGLSEKSQNEDRGSPKISASIEEQIVSELASELMETPQKPQRPDYRPSVQKNQEDFRQEDGEKEEGAGHNQRRRRWRGRRGGNRPLHTPNGDNGGSGPSDEASTTRSREGEKTSNPSESPRPTPSVKEPKITTSRLPEVPDLHEPSPSSSKKDQSSPSKSKLKSSPRTRDVVVPMTALPEGPESSAKKSPHGRWWKRLLES